MRPQHSKRPASEALAAELRKSLRGLAPAHAVMMREVIRLHSVGDRHGFACELMRLIELAPDHPEVLHWLGVFHSEKGAWAEAAQAWTRAVVQRDDDFRLCLLLGTAQGHNHDAERARLSFQRAALCASSASEWVQLSIECDRQGFYEDALAAVDAALQRDGQSAVALLQRSRCNKALGHAAAAAADCRALIAMGRETARAWFALVDLKTIRLAETELRQLEAAAQRSGLTATDRQLLDFALGKALEDAGEYEHALAVFKRANDAVRAMTPWDEAGFARRMADLRAAFVGTPVAQAAAQGREVIFIVGMPRSGSTLIEQVLAAHPDVEGASELPYLQQVLETESRRRGQPFPRWVSRASAEDWTRLGQHYLRLSARWRLHKPIATDKLPDNWLYVGAIRAMLPESRIIDCRRDPLETCWSCYKQLFGPSLAAFSYDFDSLAQYWQACEQWGDAWARACPDHVRIQSYEALIADPDAQISELLAFCQLPFASNCLNFQSAPRAIRTPSALQVRQPLRQASTPAKAFGALLQPLRTALECSRNGG